MCPPWGVITRVGGQEVARTLALGGCGGLSLVSPVGAEPLR